MSGKVDRDAYLHKQHLTDLPLAQITVECYSVTKHGLPERIATLELRCALAWTHVTDEKYGNAYHHTRHTTDVPLAQITIEHFSALERTLPERLAHTQEKGLTYFR